MKHFISQLKIRSSACEQIKIISNNATKSVGDKRGWRKKKKEIHKDTENREKNKDTYLEYREKQRIELVKINTTNREKDNDRHW